MENYPSISLCMIARNEEFYLENTLKSIAPLVSEIIFVDTGSTDSTIEIAKRYGAKIIEEPWGDDFSAPRNTSLEAATGDWILVVDADEIIHPSQYEFIRKLTLREDNCYLFVQRHYTNDQRLSSFQPATGEIPELEGNYVGYFESSLCRLFPNHKGIEYRGPVHELVEHSIREQSELKLVQTPVRLHHYGHTPEARERKNKSKLYTPLGEKKVSSEPETWKGFYELGVEHNCNGRLEESAEALKRAAELHPDYVSTWVNYGYVLVELKRYDEAAEALNEALKREKKNPEALCNFGVLYMRKADYQSAITYFQQAIAAKPDYLNVYSNLGTSLMKLNRVEEAVKVFEQGYKLAPKNGQLLIRFGYSLLEIGILDEAKAVLQQAVKLSPRDPAGWYSLGKTLEGLKLTKEAALAYEKVRELS